MSSGRFFSAWGPCRECITFEVATHSTQRVRLSIQDAIVPNFGRLIGSSCQHCSIRLYLKQSANDKEISNLKMCVYIAGVFFYIMCARARAKECHIAVLSPFPLCALVILTTYTNTRQCKKFIWDESVSLLIQRAS